MAGPDLIPYKFQDLERLLLFVEQQFGSEAKIVDVNKYAELFRTFVLRFSFRDLVFHVKSDRGIYEIDVSKVGGDGRAIWLCRALPELKLPETIGETQGVEGELSLILGSDFFLDKIRSVLVAKAD